MLQAQRRGMASQNDISQKFVFNSNESSSHLIATEMTPFKNILRADLIETTEGYEVHCGEFSPRQCYCTPVTKISRTTSQLFLSSCILDLPGCDPSDLDIQIVDDTLVIKAERSHVHSKDTDKVHTMERSFGQVSRTIKLPKDANLDDVETSFNFGVLNVAFARKAGMSSVRKLQIHQVYTS